MLLKRNGSMKKSIGNLKIHWDEWKLKDNLPKSIGVPKSVLRVKFIETQAYFRNKKNLKKKKKKNQNLVLKKIRKRGTNKAQSQNRQQQKNRNRKDNETKT